LGSPADALERLGRLEMSSTSFGQDRDKGTSASAVADEESAAGGWKHLHEIEGEVQRSHPEERRRHPIVSLEGLSLSFFLCDFLRFAMTLLPKQIKKTRSAETKDPYV
jgi:hypothetical protein